MNETEKRMEILTGDDAALGQKGKNNCFGAS